MDLGLTAVHSQKRYLFQQLLKIAATLEILGDLSRKAYVLREKNEF